MATRERLLFLAALLITAGMLALGVVEEQTGETLFNATLV